MATRFYLPRLAETVPISPTPSVDWEDVSALARAMMGIVHGASTVSGVTFTDANASNRDVLIRQYISDELTAGQTITNGQSLTLQSCVKEGAAANNLFVTFGLRVIASDGTTVRATILGVTRDDTEMTSSNYGHRTHATTATSGYTTQAGDRLTLELGAGGDPGSGSTHSFEIGLGNATETDMATDNTTTQAFMSPATPWFEMADTLTFGVGGGANRRRRSIICGASA